MAGRTYDHSEFVFLRYYLGTHGCADSSARYSYYGMAGTPNLMFNGTHQIVGASTEDALGGQYMDVIQSRYFDAAPIRIIVDSFDPATGEVSATISMYSNEFTLNEDFFHLALIEDNIGGAETHVNRAIITNPVSLGGQGNSVVLGGTFTIDPSWNQAELQVVAFVQLQNKEIVQAGSTYEQPTSSVRAMVPFSRVKVGPSTVSYESPDFTVMNVGLADDYTISVVVDLAPPGWEANFIAGDGSTHSGSLNFGLSAQESTTFKTAVTPDAPGYMRYHLEITSPNLAKPLEIPFVYITDDVDALLVDDDGGNDYEDYFTAALDDAGITYGVWELSSAKLNQEVASSIDLLIWNIGLGYPSFDPEDRAFLAQHLDAGKSAFVSGQDIGWDLCSGQSDNTAIAFYQDYLHARYISDDVNRYDIQGLNGDPVSSGITLRIAGGDGADNQDYPSQIEALGNDSVEIFSYTGVDWGAGVRSIDSVSGARVVYLAFGFEAIDNAADRSTLLGAAMEWFAPKAPGPSYERPHELD